LGRRAKIHKESPSKTTKGAKGGELVAGKVHGSRLGEKRRQSEFS